MKQSVQITAPSFTTANPGDVKQALDRRGAEALAALRASWPVDTGRSRDAFGLAVTAASGRLDVLILDGSGYAEHVNGGRSLEVAAAAAGEALDDLAEDLADLTLSALG